MVFAQNYTTWISVSLSLMLIGREDCRKIDVIAASSFSSSYSVLGLREVCFISREVLFFFPLLFLVRFLFMFCLPYLSGYLKSHPSCAGEKPRGTRSVLIPLQFFLFSAQFSHGTEHSLIIINEKHPSSSQKVYLNPSSWSNFTIVSKAN